MRPLGARQTADRPWPRCCTAVSSVESSNLCLLLSCALWLSKALGSSAESCWTDSTHTKHIRRPCSAGSACCAPGRRCTSSAPPRWCARTPSWTSRHCRSRRAMRAATLHTTRCEHLDGPLLPSVLYVASIQCCQHMLCRRSIILMLDLMRPLSLKTLAMLLCTNGCHAMPIAGCQIALRHYSRAARGRPAALPEVFHWQRPSAHRRHQQPAMHYPARQAGQQQATQSHTCFNTLLLPSNVSQLKMEQRL